MDIVQHAPTEEEIAKVKELAGGKPVFKKAFANGKIVFLYTWMGYGTYNGIVGNKMYQQSLEKDPAGAQRYLQIQVLQECVLWPSTFVPSQREELQPYPAGVIGSLTDAIMFASGFTNDAAPDTVLSLPIQPEEATEEAINAIIDEHPIAKRFGVAFEKPFFIRDYDFEKEQYLLLPTRYYVYTMIDRDTYAKAKSAETEEAGLDIILKSCVLWPQNIQWELEPANYHEWLFRSIMQQSGFGSDPSEGFEEV